MNKRGFLQDSALILIMLFVSAIAIVVAFYMYGSLNDSFATNDLISQDIKDDFAGGYDRFATIWDYSFLFIYVVIVIGAMILSYFLPSNPVFFIAAILATIILGGIAGFLSNAWVGVAEGTVFETSVNSFPIINYMMTNYILFIVIMVFLMIITFYAKGEQ